MSEILDRILDEFAAHALTAQAKDEESDLTKNEKMALCMAAGVKTECRLQNGSIIFDTVGPVGFAKINGKWTVYQGPPPIDRRYSEHPSIACDD